MYEGSIGGVKVVNTFHVLDEPQLAYGNRSAADLANDVDAWLTTAYKATCHTSQTIDTLTVREELAPDSTAVPEQGIKVIAAAGTRSGTGNDLSLGLCMVVAVKSNAAVRGGSGRMWMPPAVSAGTLTAGGTWYTSGAYWTATATFFAALLTARDIGSPVTTNHLSYVIYSRTRRRRGAANYWFAAVSYTRRLEQHFLRSRTTAP